MSHITGGKVSFGRTVKTGDYESKRADVELTFSVDEGEDHETVLNATMQLTLDKAHELLGLKAPKATAASDARNDARARGSIQADPAVKVETAGPDDPKAKGTRTRRPPVVEPSAPPAADPTAIDGIDDLGESPAAATATVAAGSTATQTSAPAAADPTAIDDELFSAAPAEVTDDALMSAITKKNAELKDPPRIRVLIGRYVDPPKQAREIPQDKRGAFMKELEALKAAA